MENKLICIKCLKMSKDYCFNYGNNQKVYPDFVFCDKCGSELDELIFKTIQNFLQPERSKREDTIPYPICNKCKLPVFSRKTENGICGICNL